MWLTPRATDEIKSQASVWTVQHIYVDYNDSSLTAQQFCAEWLPLVMKNETFYIYPSAMSILQGWYIMIVWPNTSRPPLKPPGHHLLWFPFHSILASAALTVSSDISAERLNRINESRWSRSHMLTFLWTDEQFWGRGQEKAAKRTWGGAKPSAHLLNVGRESCSSSAISLHYEKRLGYNAA